ncbi:hypothetical protein E2C01_069280 [Portunus trituberculatus]|uniref:Uncharacterized protein n=1 Tax=Portunus trituberculatus TaxID=210409 RepID=A0A5B7HR11_PORTR|nr:hypothetical protein [Portunus trituberculatus]
MPHEPLILRQAPPRAWRQLDLPTPKPPNFTPTSLAPSLHPSQSTPFLPPSLPVSPLSLLSLQ